MRSGTLAVAVLVASSALAGCNSESVLDLEPGMCFDAAAQSTELNTVPTVDCAKPHDFEVFDVFDLPSTMTFEEAAIVAAAEEGCLARFEAYVGVDYYAPEAENLGLNTLTPVSEGWEAGDFEVVCLIEPYSEDKLTGSVRNSLGGSAN